MSRAPQNAWNCPSKGGRVGFLKSKRRACQRNGSVRMLSSQREWQSVCAGWGSGPAAHQGSGLERDFGLITMGLLCHLSSLCPTRSSGCLSFQPPFPGEIVPPTQGSWNKLLRRKKQNKTKLLFKCFIYTG